MSQAEARFVHRWEAGNAPTLLLLHGTGGDESDLIPLGQMLAPGAALLSPRGNVSEDGANRFFRRLAIGVFDIEDLIARTHELADWVASAADVYGFDARRVIAVGFSNGANIAASMLLLRPDALAGAVLLHPQVPLDPPTPPDLTNKPVFIGAGRLDPLVPAVETERLADLLRLCDADVTLHWQMGGHNLSREEVFAARSWLGQHVSPGSDQV